MTRQSVELFSAGAYTGRCTGAYSGGNHAVVSTALVSGRIVRSEGQTLCQSPSRRFWGLTGDDVASERPLTCKRCIKTATRLVLSGDAVFATDPRTET